MGDTNYKESKEAFVSGATGSSVLHVNLVSSVALVSRLCGNLYTKLLASD